MVPSLGGSGWVAGACANKAFSCQISLVHEGDHVWSWLQAADTNSQAALPSPPPEQEAAQTLICPKGILGLCEIANCSLLEQRYFGAEVFS